MLQTHIEVYEYCEASVQQIKTSAGVAEQRKEARDEEPCPHYLPLADACAPQDLGLSRHVDSCQHSWEYLMYFTTESMRPIGGALWD